jgi:transposase
MGTSGLAIVETQIAGETDPARLAGLANRRMRASSETLGEALRGRVTKHHRFPVRLHLGQIDALDRAIAGTARGRAVEARTTSSTGSTS